MIIKWLLSVCLFIYYILYYFHWTCFLWQRKYNCNWGEREKKKGLEEVENYSLFFCEIILNHTKTTTIFFTRKISVLNSQISFLFCRIHGRWFRSIIYEEKTKGKSGSRRTCGDDHMQNILRNGIFSEK